MDENEETVEITGINSQGEGITRIMGKVYFVPNTVPGDWIIPLEMIEKKTFGQIPRFKIVKKSPYRQTPQCSYFENCGGCQYLHIAYEKQLEIKKDLLSGLLKKIAKVENAQEIVKKTVPSPKIFGYRNRAQFHKRGNSIGFFKQNSHEIMDIDRCILLEEQIMDFPEKIKANPQEFSTEILLASTICTEWDPNSSLPRVWTTRGLGEESFFSQINNQVNQLLIKKLQSIQNKNNNNAHLLDLYCGNGNLSIAIAPFFATITGVDLSKINIQQAKAKVDRKKFHYIQSDCLKYLKKQVSQLSQIKSTPHALLQIPDLGEFKKKPWNLRKKKFAAMMARLDQDVNNIIDLVDELGLGENTIILFSSDNGPHKEGGADPRFFNSSGGFRGMKRDLYEGGIRVPLVARWTGKIAPGTKTDLQSAFWDMLPTFAQLAGVEPPAGIDGISLVPTLLNTGEQMLHPYLYWEFHEQGGKQAVRMGDWKGIRLNVFRKPNGAIELYNLSEDPSERNNVAAKHPEIVKEISRLMAESHTPSELFNGFDK